MPHQSRAFAGLMLNSSQPSSSSARRNCNKNGIPFDPEKPAITSGIRLGTPAGTTHGFGVQEFEQIGDMIARVLVGLAKAGADGNGATERSVRQEVKALCDRFPIYGGLA